MTNTGTATGQQSYVVGVYDSFQDAEQAIEKLRDEGIPLEDVSIVGQGLQSETKVNGFITTGDVAKQGAGTGALFGSLLGLLSGAAFLFVPGFGPLVVLGPLVSTLAGAGEGAIAGGVIGAIFGKFISKQRIPKLEQQVKAGKYLVVARSDSDNAEHAHEVIQASAATEVETHDAQ
jgi:uncharacterized membrane protein